MTRMALLGEYASDSLAGCWAQTGERIDVVRNEDIDEVSQERPRWKLGMELRRYRRKGHQELGATRGSQEVGALGGRALGTGH
ncbi:unnamed protein product [Ilex paraguariensis]|uniref:Uncharacterized protein n=1 Tax=Ilex paraguariensis TaxID=185542 RepID=A0ABC8ST78_9AQUA